MIAFFHSCVCFVAFVAANVGAVKKINGFHDPRVKFPSLTTMMTPDSDVATLLKPQKLSGASTAASSQPSGLTYLEFYSEPNCAGSITYSSGYRSNLCLPANDYVRPPFADNDDFYYKFPFQTLRISNLTESCDSWYTTYYTDLNCTDVYSVVKLNDYTDCRVATDLKISNLVSVRGKCALSSSPLPVSVDSFIISDYTDKDECAESSLVSYTAYSTGTCFGYGNFSSTLFTINSTSNSVHETQYYASTNCTRTLSEYGQSDYTIGANDVCNAVQSPKAPVEDDSVAWTEFVGLSYYLAPTAMPTVAPSAAPTVQPTPAPTPNNLVLFAAQQVINGISLATYNSNATLYGNTLRMSIAACMEGVSPSNVINLVVTASSNNAAAPSAGALRQASWAVSSSSDAISTSYEVSVHDASLSYSTLSQQLTSAVTTGAFNDYMGFYSAQTGATGLQGATSNSVQTENLEPDDDDDNNKKKRLRGGVIAGIVLGGVALLLLVAVGVWMFMRRNSGQTAAGSAPSQQQRTSRNADTAAVDASDSAARAKAASAPTAIVNPMV